MKKLPLHASTKVKVSANAIQKLDRIASIRLVPLLGLILLFPIILIISVAPADLIDAATGIYGTVNFQGKIVNKSNGTNLISGSPSCVVSGASNDTCDFRLQVYDGPDPTTDTLLWQETYPNYEIGERDGVFSFEIGLCGSSVDWSGCESGSGVDFNQDNLYVVMRFDDDGDGDYAEDYFVKRMSSTPYALNAGEWDGVDLDDSSEVAIAPTQTNVSFKLDSNGSADLLLQTVGSGNVGIGDSTPDHTLDVAGNIGLDASGYINFGDTDGATGYGFRDNSGTIQYKNSSTGSWTDIGAASSLAWNGLIDPTGNLALSMTSYTTTFTYGASTGTSNLFTFEDTASNTGTGALLNIATATGSTLNPLNIDATGTNALYVNSSAQVSIGADTIGNSGELEVTGNVVISDGTLTCSSGFTDAGDLCVDNDLEVGGNITTGSITVGGGGGINFSDLTPNRLVATDSNSDAVSVEDLTAWIGGTSDEINVADDGDGTVTLSLPSAVYLGTAGQIGRDASTLIDFTTAGTIGFSDGTNTLAQVYDAGTVGNIYVTGGISTYDTTVSDNTVETGQLCLGNGTSCITSWGSAGVNYWDLTSSVLTPTDSTYDLAIGGTSLAASMFGVDESAGNFYFGYDNSANPTLLFEATDGDAGSFGFNTNDAFYFSGAEVGIGTTNPNNTLEVLSTTTPQLRVAYDTSNYLTASISSAGTVTLDATGTSSSFTVSDAVTLSSTLTVTGATTLNGAVTLGDTTSDDITFTGYVASNILPKTDDTYDLGSSSLRWQDLYLGPQTIHIGSNTTDEGTISYDATNNILGIATDTTTAGDIAFNTDDLYIDTSASRVGIGITTPTQLLDVYGNMRLDGFLYDENNSAGTAGQVLSTTATGVDWVDSSGVGTDNQDLANVYQQSGNAVQMTATYGDIRFYNDASQELLFLDESSGYVGIGTTSPGYALDVTGVTRITHSATATDPGLIVTGSGSGSAGRTILKVENTSSDSAAAIRVYNSDGKFGAMQVTGPSYSIPSAMNFSVSSGLDINFMTNGDVTSGGTNDIVFTTGGYYSSNERMRIDSDGNVGIGDTTPTYTLDVTGKIGIRDTQMIYYPDQTNFTGSLVLGDGGGSLSHTSGSQGFRNTLVGIGAGPSISTGLSNDAFGYQALNSLTTGYQNTAFGVGALSSLATGANNAGFGFQSLYQATGNYNTALGVMSGYSTTSGSENIALGYYTSIDSTYSESLVIGTNLSVAAANTAVIGTPATQYHDFYLGKGITAPAASDITLQVTGGSGTDIVGSNLILAGGKSTGNAAGGAIIFKTSDAVTSGTTLQSLSEKMRISGGGDIGIGDSTPDHTLDVAGNIGLDASGYINFGDTDGSAGYGFRDNAGTLEYKNSGGSWTGFSGGSGSSLWTDAGTYIYANNATSVVVTDTGSIGVGDTSPAYALTVGAGDLFGVSSGGAISAATGITSSGTITFSSLTAGEFVKTTTGGQLTTAASVNLASEVSGELPLANGGTGANLSDPNDDRILFWDDSAGTTTWLDIGTGLEIDGTTLGFAPQTTRLFPEYPGGVLYKDGSDNTGTLTTSTELHNNYQYNLYQWITTPSASTLQDLDVIVKWQVPESFTGFQAGTNDALIVDIATYSTSSAYNKVDVTIYKDGTTTTSADTGNVSATAEDWQTDQEGNAVAYFDDSDTVLSSLSAGDVLVIDIKLYSKQSSYARVGAITINWE